MCRIKKGDLVENYVVNRTILRDSCTLKLLSHPTNLYKVIMRPDHTTGRFAKLTPSCVDLMLGTAVPYDISANLRDTNKAGLYIEFQKLYGNDAKCNVYFEGGHLDKASDKLVYTVDVGPYLMTAKCEAGFVYIVDKMELTIINPVSLDIIQTNLRGFRHFAYIEAIVVNDTTHELYLMVVAMWPSDREIYVVKPITV